LKVKKKKSLVNSSLRFGLFHKVIFVLLFLIPVDFAFGQEKGPIIHFAQKEHDFGVLSRRECARYSFCFRNLGTEPLLYPMLELHVDVLLQNGRLNPSCQMKKG
jgi:hypothetical protein